MSYISHWWVFTCVLSVFFQAEDGIRVLTVTGVQTCALPILRELRPRPQLHGGVHGPPGHAAGPRGRLGARRLRLGPGPDRPRLPEPPAGDPRPVPGSGGAGPAGPHTGAREREAPGGAAAVGVEATPAAPVGAAAHRPRPEAGRWGLHPGAQRQRLLRAALPPAGAVAVQGTGRARRRGSPARAATQR